MRDGVGKEVGWSAVCVKESDRVGKLKCPEKADIYALSSPTLQPSSGRGGLTLESTEIFRLESMVVLIMAG